MLKSQPHNRMVTWYRPIRRYLVSLFILWSVLTHTAQVFPAFTLLQERTNWVFLRYATISGSWTGSTSFFAPGPPHETLQVEGRVIQRNGSSHSFVTADVSSLGFFKRIAYSRSLKYFDNLYRDDGKAFWPHFARYLLLRYNTASDPADSVELIRRWRVTAPPNDNWWTTLQPWQKETGYPHEFVFYRSKL